MQPDENFWKKCEGEQIANAYELEQLLGCGAFGGVFRAVQIANGKRLNKRVAVKLMLSGTIQLEELNFALDLPSHQNLVQHFAGNNVEIRGFPMFYLVMELADCSLADFVKKRGGRISSVEAKAIVRDIAQGLKFLHELDVGNSQDKRYVHRDLKLLNVLQVGGIWKIADFGLSKALDRGTMQASKIAGTPYMPPELFRNSDVSTKWDVWSLGVMIVEMLTGHFPFEADGNVNTDVMIKELERKIQRENPNLQGVPSEWIDIIKGCLVKDHARRWVAADVLKALDSMVGSALQNKPRTIPQPNPSSQKTTPVHASPSRSNGLWGTAITIGLFSGAGFIIWQITKPVNSPPIISSPSPTSTPSSEPPSVIPTITSSPSQNETVSSKTATDFFDDGKKKRAEKDFKGAIADYNKAIRLKPDFAVAYLSRGNAKNDLGDKQGAIADYNELIRLKPYFAYAYNIRGAAKYDLGDKQGAIADFTESIRLKNPELHLPYTNRGAAKDDLGDKQEAIADYNEAIRLKPDYADAYYNRGNANAKSELGDKQGAIADYNEAIRLKPDYAKAYNNRGLVKSELGDKQGAIADYNEAIRLKPDHANAYYNRGNAKSELGDKQGAIAGFNEAIRLKPDYANPYYGRGIAKSELGDKQGAIADFNEAIRLKPDYANPYYGLGLIKKKRGEQQEALADFRKASELYQQQGNIEWYNKSLDKIRELGG
ncbi:serine/threonine-protein kinase [Pseudanabaena sp. BC1403]|uniref:serine/threonine-protein kinase n=1 Tax=Pseudanabaena sp. BC1403 TaxID=2043171 RepID=UPI000CD8B282|nr:serine/threonine-protein kinase [Pseudanabaena sp. BC1403]